MIGRYQTTFGVSGEKDLGRYNLNRQKDGATIPIVTGKLKPHISLQ